MGKRNGKFKWILPYIISINRAAKRIIFHGLDMIYSLSSG